MEKRMVGSFIAQLRREKGMTQRELAEHLFVSDKTVSRWENGACDPELSLIPAIAEIFAITTDELLRGERKSPDRNAPAREFEQEARNETKNEPGNGAIYGYMGAPKTSGMGKKQFRAMLRTKRMRYRYLTLIAAALSVTGLLAAILINCGFLHGLVGFCIGAVFVLASMVCQGCFTGSAMLSFDDDEKCYREEIENHNALVISDLLGVLLGDVLLLVFLLPIALLTDPYTGLQMEYWLCYGLVFVGIALLLTYFLYIFFLRNFLSKHGLLQANKRNAEREKREKRLLVRTVAVFLSVAVVLGIGVFVIQLIGIEGFCKPVTFDNYEDFKVFMANGEPYGGYIDHSGEYIAYEKVEPNEIFSETSDESLTEELPTDEDSKDYPIRTVEDAEGNVVCEFVFNSDFVHHIKWNFAKSEDGLPVTVYTREAWFDAHEIYNICMDVIGVLFWADAILSVGIYAFCVFKGRKRDASAVHI